MTVLPQCAERKESAQVHERARETERDRKTVRDRERRSDFAGLFHLHLAHIRVALFSQLAKPLTTSFLLIAKLLLPGSVLVVIVRKLHHHSGKNHQPYNIQPKPTC
jgi:hypothetical protein